MEGTDHTYSKIQLKHTVKETWTVPDTEYTDDKESSNASQNSSFPEVNNGILSLEDEDTNSTTVPRNVGNKAFSSSNTRQCPSPTPTTNRIPEDDEDTDSTIVPKNECSRAIASSNTRQSPSPTLNNNRIPVNEVEDTTAVPHNEQDDAIDSSPCLNQASSIGEGEDQSTELKVGQLFKTRGDVREFIHLYEKTHRCKLVVDSGGASDGSISKKIVYRCAYGRERPSVATNLRPGQHTKKINCKFFIRFVCKTMDDDNLSICVSSFCEDHNHLISSSIYKQETQKIEEEAEIEWIQDATKLNMKPSQIKNIMGYKFHKGFISSKQVRNFQQKLKEPSREKEELRRCLEQIEAEGGKVDIMLEDNVKVRAICIVTLDMKKACLGTNPAVVQCDTTFKFDTSNYKMSAFLYLNPVSNRGEIAQISFLADEGAEVYKFTFSSFKKTFGKDPSIVLIDKDFNELKIVKEVFPTSTPLLCKFHVLKWWKTLLKTAKTSDQFMSLEEKNDLMKAFTKLLYVSSDDISKTEEEFKRAIDGVIVRVGYGDKSYYANLSEYYEKNWKSCATLWMLLYRRHLVGIEEEHTNNRIERFWRSVKEYLKKMTPGDMTITRAIYSVLTFIQERLEESYVWSQRHTLRMHHEDPEIKTVLSCASTSIVDRGVERLRDSLELMKDRSKFMEVVTGDEGEELVEKFPAKKVKNHDDEECSGDENKTSSKVYKTSIDSCNCSFTIKTGCPCRHILFFRRFKGLEMFDSSLFTETFKRSRNMDLLWTDDDDDEEGEEEEEEKKDNEIVVEVDPLDCTETKSRKGLTRGQKYILLGPIHERLLEAMLRCGKSKVEQYRIELEEVVENVKNGKSIFHRQFKETVDKEGNEEEKEVNLTSNWCAGAFESSNTRQCPSPSADEDADVRDEDVEEKQKDEIITSLSNGEGSKVTKSRFDLIFMSGMRTGKVGRPRDSKTKFTMKSKKGKVPEGLSDKISSRKIRPAPAVPTDQIICSYPANPLNPKQNAIYESDYVCLRPRCFISIEICDLRLKMLQPNGPSGKVWLLSCVFGHYLNGRYWELPRFKSELDEAKLYQGGCEIIFLPWCERSHFFAIIAVLGAQDRIYVMESLGGYGIPAGAPILADFIRQVRGSTGWDSVDCPISSLDIPKQGTGSNDCALFMLETATKLVENPDTFLDEARNNNLRTLFDPQQMKTRRKEMADLIVQMGEEQRQPGGPLEVLGALNLPDLGLQVLRVFQVRF